METHLQWLTTIGKQRDGVIPSARAGLAFERLGFRNDLFIAAASPETLVVIRTTGLIRFIRFHLRFTEVLQTNKLISHVKHFR